MKTASTVFSWLGAITSSILSIYLFNRGTYNIRPVLFWILFVAISLIRFIILVCRNSEIEAGNKVRCGVWTLLFVSTIGGIMTFCIPDEHRSYNRGNSPDDMTPLERLSKITKYENQLSNGEISMEVYKQKMALLDGNAQYDTNQLTEQEKINIIRQYKELLDDGLITEEEFNNKKKEILWFIYKKWIIFIYIIKIIIYNELNWWERN